MTIEPLMSREVYRCRPDDTLNDAALQLWERDCGSLPVCADDFSQPVAPVQSSMAVPSQSSSPAI